MSRPPSQAVIEVVEQVMATHATRLPADWKGSYDAWVHAHVAEVARAAEAAALRAVAGGWLIERTYGLSDEGIKGWPETSADAYRCAIEDAQSALRERADELTDTDDRSK